MTHKKVKQLLQGKGPKWFGLDRKDDACSTSRCRGPTGRKKADLVRSHGGSNVLNIKCWVCNSKRKIQDISRLELEAEQNVL